MNTEKEKGKTLLKLARARNLLASLCEAVGSDDSLNDLTPQVKSLYKEILSRYETAVGNY